MPEWFEALPNFNGISEASKKGVSAWQTNAFSDGITNLEFVPVAAREILSLAQALPLSARLVDGQLGLYADLRQDLIRRSPFNSDGRWNLGYKPLALRLLPFCVSFHGETLRLGEDPSPPEEARNDEETSILFQVLKEFANGAAELSNALQALVDAGLLQAREGSASESTLSTKISEYASVSSLGLHPSAIFVLCVLGYSHKNYREKTSVGKLVFDTANAEQPAMRKKSLGLDAFMDFGTSIEF